LTAIKVWFVLASAGWMAVVGGFESVSYLWRIWMP